MSTETRTPSLAKVLNDLRSGIFGDLRVCMPARVERYDSSLQVIDAQPLIKETYAQTDGAEVSVALPLCQNVPVQFPGGGGMRITFPVAVGDTVLLVFGDRSRDSWQVQGGLSDPLDARRHHLSDAYALLGFHANSSPYQDADPSVITLGSNTGLADFVALSSKVDTALAQLSAVFNAWVPVPSDGGAVLKTALTALIASGWPQATGSSTVKIKG